MSSQHGCPWTAWTRIGGIAGTSGTASFVFFAQPFCCRVGDIVAVPTDVPSDDRFTTRSVVAWARITGMSRGGTDTIPARLEFGTDAGQRVKIDTELTVEANQLVGAGDTPEVVKATALVIGAAAGDGVGGLYPLAYPLKPGSAVRFPPPDVLQTVLGCGLDGQTPIRLGTLATRPDVAVSLSAERLVGRHLAVLAMTGGGKTVAVRRLLRELATLGYPVLVLDPHGDYLGLARGRVLPGTKVNVFYPHLTVTAENREIVETLIERVADPLTSAQREAVGWLLRVAPKKRDTLVEYLDALHERAIQGEAGYEDGVPRGVNHLTWGVVRRSLRTVRSRLARMEALNARLRQQIRGVTFQPLPDPFQRADAIIRPRQLSVLYLGGYDAVTQSTMVSVVLERLFALRTQLEQRIPPFLVVVEEAHTLVPGSNEQAGPTPSQWTIRRILTEGRKFGVGVVMVTQRPSRVDQTALSQCNSFLVMRLVNPSDQAFVGRVMENLAQSDLELLPTFGPGQGIVGGQAVRVPLVVQVGYDEDLAGPHVAEDEFLRQALEWEAPSSPAVEEKPKASTRRRPQDD